ncbi:fimbrillin family protein [Porphyromonadaceae bacterium W3.11]|nr:fimbrillin family protein [Porphyromonadaceae bacterium W3.11]
MKKIKFYVVALAILALSMTSCDKEQNAPYSEDGNVYLTVTSSATGTRVSGDQDNIWDGNEEIGLYSTDLSATNRKFINSDKGATSKFSPATEDDKIMIPAGAGSYEVSAYYPYSAEATPDAVKYDLNKVGAQPILYAEVANVSRENPTAVFSFKHLLGKLIVNIKLEEGVEISDNLSVTLKDAETMLTLNPKDGTLESADELASLTLKRVEGENTFYSFVMPKGGSQDRVLTIINGEKTYTAKINHEIKANLRHTFNVTLKGDKVDVSDGGSDIEGSEEGGSDDVSVDPETPVDPTEITLGGDLTGDAGAQVMDVPAAGDTKTLQVNVADGQAFKVSTDADWVTLKTPTLRAAVEGTSASNVGVVVAANESSEAREATVTITSEGQESVSFTIKQGGKEEETPEEIVITPAEAAINVPTEGATGTVNVEVKPAETEWTVKSSEDWLTVTKEADAIKYTAEANTGAERNATITITAGEQTATIAVTQAKKEVTPDNNNWLYPDNDLENNFSINKNIASYSATSGRNGGPAIVVDGTQGSSNGDIFTINISDDFASKGRPKSISFYLKGEGDGGICARVKPETEKYKNEGFKFGSLNGDVIPEYGQLGYGDSFNTNGSWYKVTLLLNEDVPVFSTVKGEEFIEFRFAKYKNFNVIFSDFEVAY